MGLKRSARDAIKAQNLHSEIGLSERNAGRLSAAVRLIASGFVDGGKGYTVHARSRSNIVVSDLMKEWAKEGNRYFDLIASGEKANMLVFERAPVMACALLTLRFLPQKAEPFWQDMARDDGLSREDPRKRFLLWLRQHKAKPAQVARAFAIAWKAWVEERTIELIRFSGRSPLRLQNIDLDAVQIKPTINNETLDTWRDVRKGTVATAGAAAAAPAAFGPSWSVASPARHLRS
jgi:hypothetical protein